MMMKNKLLLNHWLETVQKKFGESLSGILCGVVQNADLRRDEPSTEASFSFYYFATLIAENPTWNGAWRAG